MSKCEQVCAKICNSQPVVDRLSNPAKAVAMPCLLLLLFASSTLACVTLPTPNGVSGKACRFPFTYQGRSYSECTTAGGFSQAWCATAVNIYGSHHATGQWGYCDSSCPGSSGSSTTSAATATGPCVTVATPNGTSGKQCRFPFTYQGQTYTQCTKAGGYPQAWCATANNIYGSHQATGQWGYCANTCPGV